MPREVKKGDTFFTTRDTALAAVLSALDFQFFDPDSSCEVTERNGKTYYQWIYETKSQDGLDSTEVLKAWKNAEKYCKENPNTKISAAISTAKNLRLFNTEIKKAVPKCAYEIGKQTVWVAKGSKHELKLKKSPRAKKL